jgi:hypothetical protein
MWSHPKLHTTIRLSTSDQRRAVELARQLGESTKSREGKGSLFLSFLTQIGTLDHI